MKRLINFLNKLKKINVFGDQNQLSDKEKEYIEQMPTQNPYGLIGMILGGIAFTFGPEYGWIPVITLLFCVITFLLLIRKKKIIPGHFT